MATLPKSSVKQQKDYFIGQKKHYRSGMTMFFSIFWKHPVLIGVSIFFTIISSLFSTLPAMFIGTAFDVLALEGVSSNFWFWAGAIISISFINIIILFLGLYSFTIASFAYERDIRQEFFDIIQAHSLTFHDEHNSSKLLSMGMTEITQIRQAVFMGLRTIIRTSFSLTIVIGLLYFIAPFYGKVALGGFVLYIIFAVLYSRRIRPVREDLANYVGTLTEANQEIFRGIEVVRGFSATQREKQSFAEKSNRYAEKNEKEGKLSAFYYPGLILLILTAIIFSLGVFDVFNNKITAGNLIQALGLLFSLQMLNFMLPQALLNFQAGLVNARRIHKIMSWTDPQPDYAVESIPNCNWKEGTLTFDQVSFSYTNNGKKALDDISITIPAGTQVALIGGPGSGKTTFLKMLLRLYDPQEGKISLDQVNYTDIPAYDIRQHVAQVEQEIFLFSSTIKDNITFAKPEATEDELHAAATAAQAHEFIAKMPKQYDTVIGERGFTLSGGQRQRLAIARAILANPNILLLDDSASAIDSKTEFQLRKALANLMANRTSITVTQRLNTLVRADLIILLDKGKIVAHGNHTQLLESCEQYQKIFELLPESERVHASGGNN